MKSVLQNINTMSTRALGPTGKQAPYAHVKGPLEGQTGATVRNVNPHASPSKIAASRGELFARWSAAKLCRMLVDCDDDEQDENASNLVSASTRGSSSAIIEVAPSAIPTRKTMRGSHPFLLIDVRESPEDFEKLHVMDAVHCPRTSFLTQDKAPMEVHMAKRTRGCWLVVYDEGTGSGMSAEASAVADKLVKVGVENVAVLHGGLHGVRISEPFALEGSLAGDIASQAAAKASAPLTAAQVRAQARLDRVQAAGMRTSKPGKPAAGRSQSDTASVSSFSAPASPGSPGKMSTGVSSIRSTASTKAPGGAAGSVYKADAQKKPTFGTAPRFAMPRVEE